MYKALFLLVKSEIIQLDVNFYLTNIISIKIYFDKEMEESISDSQNFYLKLTQYSTISDTQSTVLNNEKDIIVISDSSSSCSSPTYYTKSKSKVNKQFTSNNEVCILDSSNSDSTDTENDKFIEAWKTNKKHGIIYNNQVNKIVSNGNNALYTSDETSSGSNEKSKRYIQSSSKSSNSYASSTLKSNIKITPKTNDEFYSNKNNVLSSCTTSSTISKSSKSSDQLTKTPSMNHKTYCNIKKKLTKEDRKNIIKNIKSTKIVYESPKPQEQHNTIINESTDTELHPAISFNENFKTIKKTIDRTPVDSENDVIQDSQINETNYPISYSNRLINTPDVYKQTEIVSSELSERKKKQISQWLMTNSPDSKSDSSFSMIPASNKDDISSGNSSLERLEMNYETPNNRGKINVAPLSEKDQMNYETPNNRGKIHLAPLSEKNQITNQSPATVPRQTTLHEFTQKTNNNALELCTRKNNDISKNICLTPTINTPKNTNVMDCADILDKLYGTSWREKADVLFPKTEPRKQVTPTRNRAIQTERKKINRDYITDSDDDSDTSLADLRLQKRSVKKNTQNTKPKDSFINDRTSSESEPESLYYTALTNPGKSTNSVKSKPTLPPIVKQAIAICDTDSNSEDDRNNGKTVPDIKGRKLLFSDDNDDNDDNDDSNTSEFDPGDYVPPKSIVRKDPVKTSRKTAKINSKTTPTFEKQKYGKHPSFLASLSESVPIANAHPDAKKYRTDYKNNKENLCNYLFKLYNEQVFDKELPDDLSIEWNVRMRGTAGFCYNKKSIKTLGGIMKSSRIVLATKVLDTPDRLRDTLIHEMCHAAAWLINNVSDGHGPFWTGWAKKAMKTFPELPPIRRCHDYKIKTKFTYKCVGCGYSIGRHSKSLDIERKRCGHCYGKFELLINKTTKSGTVQVQTPKREPSAFALYVKENYSSVKKEHNIRHAQVMKILGQQFSAIKIAKKQPNFENDPDIPG
ncbi:uncharacterized protein LOC143180137 [Calliopsis andreniformis]|uniref:uncharacterized protein LOC143180137 n=1 Tax=Calliopsis andreniformis TaxID=337506 RepID=UPI003FCD8682